MTTHLSVRLTWHDSAWNGRVCQKPACNVSCVQHQHIREAREIAVEQEIAGQPLAKLIDKLPPCSRDVGAYGEQGYTIKHKDPLAHRRLLEAHEILPSYTSCPSPYRWMREENLRDILEAERVKLRPNDDGRDAGWVYEPDRQRELLKHFWNKIEPSKSLVFYYLNQANPLSEQHSRVVVGIGRIKNVGQQIYFGQKDKYTDDYPIWSRAVTQDYPAEGVRLPYQEYLIAGHAVAAILCPVPSTSIAEFSYVGEHISDDVALSVVERFIQSVEQVKADGFASGEWNRHLAWLDEVLQELWQERGAFPGIGSVLQYLGFSQGIAYQRFILAPLMRKQQNTLAHVEAILNGTKEPELDYREGLLKARVRWQKLFTRQKLLATLSRFELTQKQVERIANPDSRIAARILSTDDELLTNPYLICEQDIGSAVSDLISLETIDHGTRPEGHAAIFPPTDEMLQDDPRRVRAIAIDILKLSSINGDSLLSMTELLDLIKKRFPESRQCRPDLLLIEADQDFFHQVLSGDLVGNNAWCALNELHSHEKYIAELIKRRATRTNKVDWESKTWQDRLYNHPNIGQPSTEREKQAIAEKLSALEVLFTQRISILTGGAGTGKTTVLKVFIDGLDALEGRQPLLLLAPTGKARVRLAGATNRKTETIHQLLFKQGWYDAESFILKNQSDRPAYIAKTVVIDECSMIPSDLFGTLLLALDKNEITRLILVGDPNQLPPIGPGRPFADIIRWLANKAPHCIAKLDTCMRTVAGDEHRISTGLELANSYRSNNDNPADDELLSALAKGEITGDVEIHFWKEPKDMMEKIQNCFEKDMKVSRGDYKSFSNSLGVESKEWHKAENWQILSPTRRDMLGTDEINRLIQSQFKGGLLSNSRNPWKKSFAKPFGDSEIIWTDKVIQVVNGKRNGWPRNSGFDYVANGEIGLVESTTKDYLQIRFSTQPDISYRYYRNEVNGLLELAYALTVHKAQGSDFDTVYFIVPQAASTLTRELIYTGLTRFRRKLVLLVEGDIQPLLRLRTAGTSDLEQRNSFVFDLKMRSEARQIIFADSLIHRAKNGVAMRSKSEVIVANILIDLGLNPRYEDTLYAKGSTTDFRLPDFTVSYEGDTFYWEHLGMLSMPSYQEAWERKIEWYKKNELWESVITSEDKPDGGIDAAEIELIAKVKILQDQ